MTNAVLKNRPITTLLLTFIYILSIYQIYHHAIYILPIYHLYAVSAIHIQSLVHVYHLYIIYHIYIIYMSPIKNL